MKKPNKVKRYSNIYNQKRRRRKAIINILLGVASFAIIAGTVFLLATLIFGGSDNGSSKVTPSEPIAESSEIVSSESSEEQSDNASQTVVVAKELPINLVGSPTKISDFAATAKNEGYNAIVVPMKTQSGEILYNSKVAEATSWGAISSSPTDADAVINAITSQGLTPIAELYAFEDDIASHAKRGNSYYYGTQTTTTRLFGSGKGISWLNPYQDSARKYICDLSKELYDMGFKGIWLNGVQFPTQGIDSNTGTNANGRTQEEILKTFISEMEELNIPFVISYEWDSVGGGANAQTIYGGDPTTYGAPGLSPILDSSAAASTQQLKDSLAQTKSQASDAVIIPSVPASANLEQVESVLNQEDIQSYILLSE